MTIWMIIYITYITDWNKYLERKKAFKDIFSNACGLKCLVVFPLTKLSNNFIPLSKPRNHIDFITVKGKLTLVCKTVCFGE